MPRTDDANEAARAWRGEARDRSLEEQNRLLYVAMTRAEDRLYVGGWVGSRKPDRGCWYERIETGLRASSEAADSDGGLHARARAVARPFDFTTALGVDGWEGDGYELINQGRIVETEQPELPIADEAPLPDWWSEPAPERARSADAARTFAAAARRGGGRTAGLQSADRRRSKALAARPAAARSAAPSSRACRRRRAATRPAASSPSPRTSSHRRTWRAGPTEALSVTETPAHAALFAQGSRAEVPLIGTVKTARGTFTVSGQVDRLAVSATEVLIVDYKTNRPPPDSADGVALAYRRQLALYRALLQQIYPGRTVRAFLLWTAAPAPDGDLCRNPR